MPLYKGKGKRTHSSSYRAIFGLTFIVKIFEKILYDKILYYVYDCLDDNQHGFRKHKSCETVVSTFTQNMYSSLDKKGGKGIVIYIDFTKAFDSIDQSMFIKKLMTKFSNKIPQNLIGLLIIFFSNRGFRIVNGDYKSKYYKITAGVSPGSILGPLCFSLFLNDIGEVIDLPYSLYADDLVIYTECDTFENGKLKLQNCLDEVSEWCRDNGLKINVSKTKYMLFFIRIIERGKQRRNQLVYIYMEKQ